MENDYRYGREKLYQAVSSLVGTGSIQDRLEGASLYLIRLQPPKHDVPKELHDELNAIVREMNTVKAIGDEGSTRATLRTLSDEQCDRLAARIFSLFVGIRGGI